MAAGGQCFLVQPRGSDALSIPELVLGEGASPHLGPGSMGLFYTDRACGESLGSELGNALNKIDGSFL